MLILNSQIEDDGLQAAARQICIAARTAPKGKGKDLLVTGIVSGDEKGALVAEMRRIGNEHQIPFFLRDADNVDLVSLLVLLGTRKEPLGLPVCGFCGFKDCGTMLAAGGTCEFNSTDLGVAVGSAVSLAADLRIDNRVMFSAGKAALNLKILGPDVQIAYGIPLSVTSKSPFFDRH